jgi:Domain of unknown function(DUF2779)
MDDERVPAIFEAAFEFDGIRIRVDVLERLGFQTWGLREVKSSTALKDHYVDDIALQAYVLQGLGMTIPSIELLHVNKAYIRGPDGIIWEELFARIDLGETVAERMDGVPARLPAMGECLAMSGLPPAEPGSQCGTPYPCPFWSRCIADKPVDWIAHLPRLSEARANDLQAQGIESIAAIPNDFPLSCRRAIIRDAIASGEPYLAPDLAQWLSEFGPPACYLDFETMMPPIPLYEGTRPYQTIPFQWSLHAETADGVLHHQEFLAESSGDPRRRFAET